MTSDVTIDGREVTAQDGRVPGRRGRRTRGRLLAATEERLAATSYRDLKVVDIARDAGTSPATFYQYFSDVEEAVLVLAEQMLGDIDALVAPLEDAAWSDDAATGTALELADAFLEFWDDHEPILRVVNLAIGEGDRRFRRVRNRLLGPVTEALQDQLVAVRGDEPGEVDPAAEAAVLVSMLVHVAEHHPRLRDWGVDVDALRRSMARSVCCTVRGRPPAG